MIDAIEFLFTNKFIVKDYNFNPESSKSFHQVLMYAY